MSKGAAWGAYGGITFVALGTLGVDTSPVLASLSVAGITVGFAARDLASNYISGLLMAVSKPFMRGDHITVGKEGDGVSGIIEKIDMRYTFLRPVGTNEDGVVLMVPNSAIMSSVIQMRGYHWEDPHQMADAPAAASDTPTSPLAGQPAVAPPSQPTGALVPLLNRAFRELGAGDEARYRWLLARELTHLDTARQKVVLWAAVDPVTHLRTPEWAAYVAEAGGPPAWMPTDLAQLVASATRQLPSPQGGE